MSQNIMKMIVLKIFGKSKRYLSNVPANEYMLTILKLGIRLKEQYFAKN